MKYVAWYITFIVLLHLLTQVLETSNILADHSTAGDFSHDIRARVDFLQPPQPSIRVQTRLPGQQSVGRVRSGRVESGAGSVSQKPDSAPLYRSD